MLNSKKGTEKRNESTGGTNRKDRFKTTILIITLNVYT